jgi:hypothetical protein
LVDGTGDGRTHEEAPSPSDPVSERARNITKDVNAKINEKCGNTDPPRRGPTTLAKEKTAPKVPNRSGRCSSLVAYETTVIIEVKIPLAPTPAIARPKIYQ